MLRPCLSLISTQQSCVNANVSLSSPVSVIRRGPPGSTACFAACSTAPCSVGAVLFTCAVSPFVEAAAGDETVLAAPAAATAESATTLVTGSAGFDTVFATSAAGFVVRDASASSLLETSGHTAHNTTTTPQMTSATAPVNTVPGCFCMSSAT